MPDKKLTDSEIVKALECCSTASCISNKCHYEKLHDIPTCTTKLTKDALDLINRLQAEIERLEDVNIRLTKAEAHKEFAERLKSRFLNKNEVINNTIDNLLKELVGENNV